MKVLDLQNDLKSSVVVFLVALPLCLGIALASNAPLASGLIAGIIGGIIVGFASDSHISVSGPAAGLTVIVANGIAQLGGFETFGLAVLLAGLFQIVFGLVKGGAIGNYFPTAVIKGMLAAIGLILIIKQFPNALGLPKGSLTIDEIKPGVALISFISICIMLGWEKLAGRGIKLFQFVPGALIAVVVSVIVNQFFHFAPVDYLVQLPEKVFTKVSLPDFGNFSFLVVKVALTIAIVASLETLLCIDAADKIDPEKRKTNKDRELLAQGVGNSLAGLLGGLPLTAVIVRTSANVSAGAKTKMSAVFHSLWLLLCVFLIPGLLNLIPLATLACVLLLVGYKLTKPAFFVDMYKRGWEQLLVFCVTIISILMTDLLIGIFVGLILALLFEVRSFTFSAFEVVEEGNKIHLKFNRDVSFLHKAKIQKVLNGLTIDKQIYLHNLKLVKVNIDVHEMILEYDTEFRKKGMEIFYIS